MPSASQPLHPLIKGAVGVLGAYTLIKWHRRGSKDHGHSHYVNQADLHKQAEKTMESVPVIHTTNLSRHSAEQHIREEYEGKCHDAALLGLPSDQEVRCYGGFLSSLNFERRVPNWVVEVLHHEAPPPKKAHAKKSAEREEKRKDGVTREKSVFFADPSIDPQFQVTPQVYEKSGIHGISKGHLAAAQFHKASQDEMDATFNMNANIVPQDSALNALDWFRLEQMTRRISKEVQTGPTKGSYTDPSAQLYVATGPAFVPQGHGEGGSGVRKMAYDVIEVKNQMVAVPTHLYKVIVSERREKKSANPHYSAAAFLVPNEPLPEEVPLSTFQVPVAYLESLTGLQFFSGVKASTLPNLCSTYKCDSRPSPFTERFRPIAQLRSAGSAPELRERYHKLEEAATQAGGKVDPMIEKEYKRRMDTFVAVSTEAKAE